jgi:undecaprenyl diphosphate synthase
MPGPGHDRAHRAGEYRLSNFLLWQAAYAELVFLDLPWPDFREHHFQDVLRTYTHRTRTFGAVHGDRSPTERPSP